MRALAWVVCLAWVVGLAGCSNSSMVVKGQYDKLQKQQLAISRQNQELQKTNARLKELNRMKTQFLAVATHEIRTPLSIVIGYNHFLLQEKAGAVYAEQKRILEESVQSCERLLNIVNEMLDFSRIETGNLQLHLKENNVLELLERVYRQMKIISDRASLGFFLRIPSEPIVLKYDTDRIEQVLVNLISNAIKFTPSGGVITLSASERFEKGETLLDLSISDTGKGLSPSLQDKIFEEDQPFIETGLLPSQKKGVGLGLAISKRIVEAHGGRIWVKSKEGQGATFTFCLPGGTRPETKDEQGIR